MRVATAALLGLVLVLACANPVQIGVKGLREDVNSLEEKIEAEMVILDEVAALEKEKIGEELKEKIDELKAKIGKAMGFEEEVKSVSDSLATLEKNPKATEPLKGEIAGLKGEIEKLTDKIASLKDADARLNELKVKIEEKAKPGTKARPKIQKKVY